MIRKTILIISALLVSGIAFAQYRTQNPNWNCPRNPSGQCLRNPTGQCLRAAKGGKATPANGTRRKAAGGRRGCWRGNL